MLGLLLARQGIDVTVLEKHADFLRDFRGDDIAAATLEILHEVGLADAFLAANPKRVRLVRAHTGYGTMTVADLSLVRTRFPFVAVIPQWDLLNLLTTEAARFPTFRLLRETPAQDLIVEDGVVAGVRHATGTVRADLTVAADGRTSVLREKAALPLIETAPPIDLLIFRLPRLDGDPEDDAINIHLGDGWAMARLDRGTYWQAACVIPKGAADEVRALGVGSFRDVVRRVMPDLGRHVGTLDGWEQVHLLSVRTDRLRRWYRPGLLFIGDSAHAMSPIGGTGVNFAIQDAVVAANRLAGRLRDGGVRRADLAAIQRARAWQVIAMQSLQRRLMRGYLTGARSQPGRLRAAGQRLAPKLLDLPGFTALRSHLTAVGFRRVHVAPHLRTPRTPLG
jgi:2-polyprenyl-6-methoxyphenol hydroxylase-like FAD-dependent oxidoreductase